MGETVLVIITLLLALYGFTELIGRLVMRLLRSSPSLLSAGVLIVPISGTQLSLEQWIRSIVIESRWNRENLVNRILLVDFGMDEETQELAQCLCNRFPQVTLTTSEQVPERLQKLFKDGLTTI